MDGSSTSAAVGLRCEKNAKPSRKRGSLKKSAVRSREGLLESPLPHLSRKGEENDTGGHLVGLAIEQKVPGALCYEQDVVEVQRVLSAVGPDEIGHLPDVRRVEQQLATVLGAVKCHVTHRRKVPTGLRCVHSTSPATRRKFDG